MKTVCLIVVAIALAHAAFDEYEVEPFDKTVPEEVEPEGEFTEATEAMAEKAEDSVADTPPSWEDEELDFMQSPVNCDPNKAKREANAKLANALKKTIRFDPNKTTLRKSSYATLNGVAKTLSQFPWLEVNIIGHSTARGYHCTRLTKGRASTVIKYLVGKGAKNKMNPKSQCGKMIGVEMKAAGGNAPIPLAAIKKCKEEVASKEGKKKADEKADKAAAKKEKASKAKEKSEKAVAEKTGKEKTKKEKAKKVAKEKSDKEKVKKKEKADKLEKVAKEKSSKEKTAKAKEKVGKEKAAKEKDVKEKEAKESASKEAAKKERAQKEKEKAKKAQEKADKAEKKTKELAKKKQERASKEMAEKERAQKAKERAKKEKTTKLKEKADKEKKSKEQAAKEKTAKAKEKAAKEKASKETKAKEKASKEKASKERAAKIAAEKAAKEKASKVAAERASKERTKKVTVTYHAWTGWINNMDHPVNYVRGANTNLYLSGLYGMHSNYYEDRQFKVINTRIGSTVDRVSQTGYVNNMDQAFAYSCPANMAIIGLASYHQNWYEDRRWKITCGHFKGMNVQAFGWPGAYQTKQDAVFNLNCGSNPMIGIGAAHSNWYEDRVFRIRCGKLVLRA